MKIFILISLLTSLLNSQMVLVTNKDSNFDKLSHDSIKYLYLGKIDSIDGIRIKPLRTKNKEQHNSFVNHIINKNISQYNSYWARLVFTGRKSIPKRLSEEEVKEELSKINTVIYMDKEDVSSKWKIIYEHK